LHVEAPGTREFGQQGRAIWLGRNPMYTHHS
jgi:hypothetical protein